MSSDDLVISINHLSKRFKIYDSTRSRIKQLFYPLIRQVLKKKNKNYFREFWALKDISIEIKKNETVGIIGRNGSGKSTLLQIICGTLSPTSGDVKVKGRVAALLELGSGFNPEFTGRENIYMNAAILGLTQAEIDGRFNEIMAFADIGQFIEQPIKTYSSGMLVRLAFAVIAHVDADILIIDEALAVGDAFFTQKCMRFLRNFMKNGTVLFVSHDISAITSFCQKVIYLNNGTVVQSGDPKTVTQKYLAELYESHQGQSETLNYQAVDNHQMLDTQSRDMRLDFINSSAYRNDIEVIKLVPNLDGFGKGGGKIVSAQLLDQSGKPLSWIVGGERVKLIVSCKAFSALSEPIIGFYMTDRLGQSLFGENTYNFTQRRPQKIDPGENFLAVFEFNMPILPRGDFAVTVALANGNLNEHVQHHWVHDGILLTSHSTSVSTGLVGIPMLDIRLERAEESNGNI